MVTVFLDGAAAAAEPHCARWFRQALMAGAVRSDGLDHVFARTRLESLEIVLFVIGDTAEVAEVKAVSLCERVIDRADGTDLSIRDCHTREVGQW